MCNGKKIFEIQPYDYHGALVFDDPTVDLVREPFVEGTPEILYGLCESMGIENPKLGFSLKFSESPFEGTQAIARKLRLENGGAWYAFGSQEGWLCPMLYRYYQVAPDQIYFRVDPLRDG